MSTTCVLKPANVQSSLREPGCSLISLLGFLQAENRKLQDAVAQLQRDTTALREALQNS